MLDAARAVFAERGYSQATLDEIAQLAEFGKGTLYNYFPDGKEELLFAIFDELYDELVRHIHEAFTAEVAAGQPAETIFQGFMERTFTFFLAEQDLFLIAVKEAHRMIFGDDPERVQYFMRQRNRLVDALVPPIQTAIDAGQLRPFAPESVAHMLLGNIEGMQMHLCLEHQHTCDGPPPSPAEAARFLTTMLFHGLLTNPSPGAPLPATLIEPSHVSSR